MKRFIPTRWSHLLAFSGVGALVRADNDLFVVMDIRHWTDQAGELAGEPLCYVDLLRGALGLDGKRLLQPPLARLVDNGAGDGAVDGTCVPAIRFPRWTRCPSCGLLHYQPWDNGERGRRSLEDPRCSCEKRSRLRQVDWVVAHPEGGLWEVPWHLLAHKDTEHRDACRPIREQPYLRLRRDAAGYWQLRCERCQSQQPFSRNQQFKDARRARLQPWQQGEAAPTVPSQRPAAIIEVNDSRLYSARVRGGLVIPPESQVARGGVLDRLYRQPAARRELERCRTELARRALLRRLSDELGCTRADLEDALRKIEDGWPLYGEMATPGLLLEKEYRALTTPIPDQLESEDFVTEHHSQAWRSLKLVQTDASQVQTDASSAKTDTSFAQAEASPAKTDSSFAQTDAPFAHADTSGAQTDPSPMQADPSWASPETSRLQPVRDSIQQLVSVSRLREIRIFTGFHRVEQWFEDGIKPDHDDAAEPETSRLVPPDLDGRCDWLPAIELYGEGLFFTLDEALLRRWEAQDGLWRRAEQLQARFERTGIRLAEDPPLPLTPRFILLHTLAHLLIRHLETAAGYPAASIRERLYCSSGAEPMAGVLVYVAVADVAGSLGGLAELAEPRRFLELLVAVFDHANWCSLDPVCAEHPGQGPSQLNRAACHACALVPEPSCQFSNVLLDRVFIAGDLSGTIRSLLDFAVER
ncbi:MAG: DUF1998 domain-containing protein [Chromatiaceae bacterium]|nr:DUF1998 domain-containing protein [Chromatiaceae bacterium]